LFTPKEGAKMREAKKYFVLFVLLVVIANFGFFHAVAAPVLAQSIVPNPGAWSSDVANLGDKGGTFFVNFDVSEDRKKLKASIFILDLSVCGMSGSVLISEVAADIQKSAFSITSPAFAPPEYVLEGAFISPTKSEGTFTIKGGDCEAKAEWVATSETDAATSTAAPTLTPTMTATASTAAVGEKVSNGKYDLEVTKAVPRK
jgi:hypothetical protein